MGANCQQNNLKKRFGSSLPNPRNNIVMVSLPEFTVLEKIMIYNLMKLKIFITKPMTNR